MLSSVREPSRTMGTSIENVGPPSILKKPAIVDQPQPPPTVCTTHAAKLFMLMNYTSSISIVFLNKIAFRHGFPSITLTMIHFLVTFAGLKLCSLFGVFTPKEIPVIKVLPLALAFCGFVVFTNLSLQYNTVGFYQMAKMLTTPFIIIVQTSLYGKTFSRNVKASIALICFGVFLAGNSDITFNVTGTAYAACGIVVTAFYQIWVKSKQKDLDVNAFQLLFYQAPLSSLLLGLLVPIMEPPFEPNGLLATEWSGKAKQAVVGSALMSFAVNLSIFLVIGKTSPMTYNVLGHAKLCTVLIGGFLLFQDPLNFNQGLGIATTLMGVFAYTHFKLKEAEQEKAAEEMKAQAASEELQNIVIDKQSQ